MNFRIIASFNFNSGNSCDVLVDMDALGEGPGVVPVNVQWEFCPPSALDMKTWSHQYFPKVSRKIQQMRGGSLLAVSSDGKTYTFG